MDADGIRIARVAEHSFLAAPITTESVIVDLGVNAGEFATAMIRRYGCSVVGVEPVPHLFDTLPRLERLTVEQLAMTSDGHPVTLYLNPSATAATIDRRLSRDGVPGIEVDGITLAGILDRHDLTRAPLVKVDIEGAEIQMLKTASVQTLLRVDQFTIEFHDFLGPDLVDDVRQVKQRLRAAGFAELAMSGDNSDVLFINRARIRFGALHHLGAAIAYKYPRGLGRKLERWLRARRPGPA
jgi:FkbM family methyltransferase